MKLDFRFLALVHAASASVITIGLLLNDIFQKTQMSFWIVVLVSLSWLLWFMPIISNKAWITAGVGLLMLSPAAVIACRLLLIAFG